MVYYLHILFIYLLYLLPFNFFSFFSHSLILQFFSLLFLPTFHFNFTCSSSFHHKCFLFTFSVLLFFLPILLHPSPSIFSSIPLFRERENSHYLSPIGAMARFQWPKLVLIQYVFYLFMTESSLFKKRLFLSFMGHNKTGSNYQNDFIQSLNFTLHLWQYCKRSQNTE